MEFYREQIVHKPRKIYYCDACGSLIADRHIYVVGKSNGDFYYGRYHLECWAEMSRMCSDCEYRGDCMGDRNECYQLWKEREVSDG
jgi:hypothetical protein